MVAAAAAERTAAQASDADSGASTSYSLPKTGRRSAATPAVPSPPPSTVLSLAEYQLLMEAKEQAKREEEERKRREAGTAVAVPEPAPLDISRQGFQSFAMDGGDWELLVAETADGRLALADSYVARGGGEGEGAQQSYSRPSVEEDVPAEPLLFQVIPWVERGSSDLFKRRKSSAKVKKVFFVSLLPDPEEPQGEPLFDLDNVFVFDGGSKGFSRTEVRQVHSGPLLEPVLRIRPSGLTLEESFLVPDPIEISEGAAADLADVSEEELAERLAELEKQAEMMDEMDEMPDVPSVDMM
ncbi:hypothetical protein HYH03_002462 [Edaphochlamys debaryana]|uniref:Uncharacterized protein n=1 Tax=Edaphochlamys debaryana TaxID=47281 RepID=A0A835YAS3_9CHLO|nr:hypothetical protein HYH03_002462 [Edaphochlamys debaryana]|eukprot:KAG2499515.1 hypothetical protein HYH03_002462 [Edaphochlamys debaryana]